MLLEWHTMDLLIDVTMLNPGILYEIINLPPLGNIKISTFKLIIN